MSALTKCGRIGLSGICNFSVRSEKPMVLADLLSWPTCALPPQRGASRPDAVDARQRAPLALPPARALARRSRHDARPLEMQLEPGVAPAEAMVPHQMLVERLDRETQVALAIEPLDFFRAVARDPFARRLAEPAVDEAGPAFLLVAPPPA